MYVASYCSIECDFFLLSLGCICCSTLVQAIEGSTCMLLHIIHSIEYDFFFYNLIISADDF